MNWQRYLIWTSLAVAIGAALYAGLRPQPALVETALVREAPLEVTVEEEGQTRVKNRYLISVPVAGFVRRIDLDVGDSVTPRQILTELEPLRSNVLDPRSRAEAQARIAAARAALMAARERLEVAKADADFARDEFERRNRLQKTGSISEEQVSQSRTEMRRADAQLRSAKFSVDVAKHELDAAGTRLQYSAAESNGDEPRERVPIFSPIDGVVLTLHRESEGVVAAGTPLVEVGDPRALEIAVDMLSFDAIRVQPGTPVVIERWGGAPLSAVVRLVEPVGFTKISALGVEEQRVWVVVDITSPPEHWQRLGDGYRVEARFILWREDKVVQAPNSALFRMDEGWGLFAVEGDRAELRKVDIGERNGLSAQILSGAERGDTVITHPDGNLEDGARVQTRH